MIFKETFSEIPGLYELPKKISSVFETNKGVAEKKLWQDILLQTFEKICILLAQISIYEYKNSPFAKEFNQVKGSPAYKLETGLNNSSIIKKINTLSWGNYMQIISSTRSLFNSNREYSKKFVSANWLDDGNPQESFTNYSLFFKAIQEYQAEIESNKISIRDAFEKKKESYELLNPNQKKEHQKAFLAFLGLMVQVRNKIAHADIRGSYWPMTAECLVLSLELLKPCLETLISELSPLWKYQLGVITNIHPQSIEVCVDHDSKHQLFKSPKNLSLNKEDEFLYDPTSKKIVANLNLSKSLYLSPYVEEILREEASELRRASDVEAFKEAVRKKLEDDHVIDLAERRELESVGRNNLEFSKEETEKIILEVAISEGIEEPFAKFDPAFVEILDHAIKSGDIDEMVLGLQSKTYGLEFGDFKKLLRERILKLGFNPTQFSTVERLNVLSQELTDARCITEACCWLRDLKRLNAEKGGLYISESTMCKGYETRTGKHQRIFDEIRQILSDRIDRLSGSESWQTKVNTKWRSNMPSYLSCHSYNTQLKVGYKRKLAGGELHLILWVGHHDKDPSIPLSKESDWSFLRIGVGYTKELMPGGRKYNPNNFDYALYERIVSEITKETIREYYDAFVSHPDLYLFNHSLTNSLKSRDEMVPVSELDPKSEKLDYYFRHNPGLKTLCFVNQWPLLKKNPVKVLRNLDASFLLLSEMLNEIERNYEISIRATNSDSETKSGIRSNRGSGFHGITSTLRECLNETKKQLPKKLRNKVKEDHPKSGKGSRFVDSISLNKQDVDRGLVELVYGFWQGENKGEILCGFDARTALRSRPLSEEESNPSEDILYQFFQSFNGSEQPSGKGGTKRKVDTPNYFYQPNHLSFRTTLKRNEKTDYEQTDIEETWEETKVEITKLLGFSDGKFVKLF